MTVISDIAVEKELNKIRVNSVLEVFHIPKNKKIIGTLASDGCLIRILLNMLEAIYIVSKQRNDFVFLHFGMVPLIKQMNEKVKEYNLGKVYKIMGFHEKAEDFFCSLEGFVMSSEEEGLGNSVLDAFLYNVPVASTNAGGLKDLLNDERGEVCEIHSPEKLAICINAILDNSEKTKKMVINANSYVKQFHSMEYITNQYLALLK